jgi:hypothetical protein
VTRRARRGRRKRSGHGSTEALSPRCTPRRFVVPAPIPARPAAGSESSVGVAIGVLRALRPLRYLRVTLLEVPCFRSLFGLCYEPRPETEIVGRCHHVRPACRSPGAPTSAGEAVPGCPAGPCGHDGGGGNGDRAIGRDVAGGRIAAGSCDAVAPGRRVHGGTSVGMSGGGVIGGTFGVGGRFGGDHGDVLETGSSTFPSPCGACGVVRRGAVAVGRVRPRRPDVWRCGVGGWRGCPAGAWGTGGRIDIRGSGGEYAGGSSAGAVGLRSVGFPMASGPVRGACVAGIGGGADTTGIHGSEPAGPVPAPCRAS